RTHRDHHRRNAFHFDFPLDRDDRAVTDARSTAGEDDRISTRALVNLIRNFARGPFIHRFQLHRVAHITNVLFSEAANYPSLVQVAQNINRKYHIYVFICVTMIIVMMRDHEVRRIYVWRNLPIAEVTEFVSGIEGLLVFEVHAAGGNEGDGTFGKFTLEGREGNALAGNGHGESRLANLNSTD